jgi:DNA polymerase II small subunit/DNA polymerase delta subunit B
MEKDMKSKIEKLRESIGKTMSHNYSPTLRAKLVKVNKVTCVLEVTKGEYVKDKDYTVGMRFKDNVSHTWNALYY